MSIDSLGLAKPKPEVNVAHVQKTQTLQILRALSIEGLGVQVTCAAKVFVILGM